MVVELAGCHGRYKRWNVASSVVVAGAMPRRSSDLLHEGSVITLKIMLKLKFSFSTT